MRINNHPQLRTLRKTLRNQLTPAEAKLWTLLKSSQLEGRKFRRQHSVGRYVLDFYCPGERLAVELDGTAHDSEAAQRHDDERARFLQHHGIKVLRFENKWIFQEPEAVLAEIKSSFGWQQPPHPKPPRPFGAPLLEKEGSCNSPPVKPQPANRPVFNSPPAKGEYPKGEGVTLAKGDNALFGKSTQAMKAQWNVPDSRPLADFAPTIILKAKDFATEITIHNARTHGMQTEPQISREHVSNNQAVRQALLNRGIRPESLPPAEDVKKVERRLASADKKSLQSPDRLPDDE